MEDEIVCADCGAEPADPKTAEDDGWDLTGEFGEVCPECRVQNAKPSSAGLDAVAAALGAEKKETP